jgi:carbon monoxide dehydrogenase subunit G
MAFTVPIEINREFDVVCPYDRVFTLLADVPKSASHFPQVEQLVDLGGNTFRWEMEKLGLATYSIQTIYACAYTDSREEGWVEWKPVPGEGNALIEGFWNFEEDEDGKTVHVEFHTKGDLTLKLPFLAKLIVSPLVVMEFNGLIDRYVENLKQAFA